MKKLIFPVVLALVALLVPDAATAGTVANGPGLVLQGPALNGVTWNGPVLQGIRLNGAKFNSPFLQGVRLNGAKLNGPILQGVLLNGISLQGPVLQGARSGLPLACQAGETLDFGALSLTRVTVRLPQGR